MTGVCEHAEGKLSCQEVIVYDFHCESNFLNVFIREQKILHAQELLLFGKYSVKKTAELSFFSSAAHFRRLFVKCCGQSPLKWKKEKMACDVVKYEGFRGYC